MHLKNTFINEVFFILFQTTSKLHKLIFICNVIKHKVTDYYISIYRYLIEYICTLISINGDYYSSSNLTLNFKGEYLIGFHNSEIGIRFYKYFANVKHSVKHDYLCGFNHLYVFHLFLFFE